MITPINGKLSHWKLYKNMDMKVRRQNEQLEYFVFKGLKWL
jgi:hypothetical protein